ncbi:SdrD B-like domain-containing protein, partial [uncultured Tenacibaculum sp.]|uniref:SdrD B-like domain-containing protein n=1 Tax=uncultured Tenacibaculum sp. TaxID=174713 RepID=UPI00261F0B9B
PSTTTNPDGSYTLTGVPAGSPVDIVVVEGDLPSGSTQTEGTNPTSVTPVGGGSVDAGSDGYQSQGDVTGVVYGDTNGNGTQDGSESGLGGVTVYADLDGDGVQDPGEPSTTTNPDGSYTLTGVPAGSPVDIVVVEGDLPSGSTQTEGTNPTPVTPVGGGSVDAGSDGYQSQGDVTGVVYGDTNGNGTQDGSESGLGGVTVYADLDGDGVQDPGEPSTTTNPDGSYTLTGVPAGSPVDIVVVEGDLPSGSTQTEGTNPTSVTPVGGGSVDAGNDGYQSQGDVTGVVYGDTNGNGTQDGSESGLGGVTVYADLDGDGVQDPGEPSTTTNPDGSYTLTGVPAGSPVDIVV